MVQIKELKNQTEKELEALYHDLSKELFGLRNERQIARKVEKPHLMKGKRKDRARVMTVLRQKQIESLG